MHSDAGDDEDKDTVDNAGSTAVTVMMLATETVAWVHSDNRDGDAADHYSVPTIAIPFFLWNVARNDNAARQSTGNKEHEYRTTVTGMSTVTQARTSGTIRTAATTALTTKTARLKNNDYDMVF